MLSLLLGMTCVPAAAAESAGTLYVAVETPDEDVQKGKTFTVSLNFSNNPDTVDESLQAYLLLLSYDSSKVKATKATGVETGQGSFENSLDLNNEGVAALGWAGADGVSEEVTDEDFNTFYTPLSSGTLATVTFGAKQDLSAADMAEMFKLVETCGDKSMSMSNGLKQDFDIVVCPAVSAELSGKTLYSSADAAKVKEALASVTYIDATGTATTITSADGAWSDVEVTDVTVSADQTLTATVSYKGQSTTVSTTVTPVAVISLTITTQPKLGYASGEALDLSAMTVKASFNNGEVNEDYTSYTTSVADGTALTVAANHGQSITVTDTSGSGVSVKTDALTVAPKSVEIPTAAGTYTYTGSEQTFAVGNDADKAYYDITGETSGVDAGSYTASAALKDDTETAWSDGTAADKALTWVIGKAEAKEGVTLTLPVYFGAMNPQVISVSQFDAFQNEPDAAVKSVTVAADDSGIIAEASGTAFTLTSGLTKDSMGKTATLNVVIASKNYADTTATLTVKLVGKTNVTVTMESASITYGDSFTPVAAASKEGFQPQANGFTYYYKESTASDSTYTTTQPTDAGAYTVMAVYEDEQVNDGVPGYTGSATATLTIKAKSVADSDVSIAAIPDEVYTGEAKTPALTVTFGGKTLVKDVDYTAAYSANVDAGEATVTVTGKGNYTDAADKAFSVTAHDVTGKSGYVTGASAQNVVVGVGSFTAPTFRDTRETSGKTIAGTVTYFHGSDTTAKSAEEIKAILAAKSKGETGSVSWKFVPIDANYTGALTGSFNYELVDILFQIGGEPATMEKLLPSLQTAPAYGTKWSAILGKLTNPSASVDGVGDGGSGSYTVKVDGEAYDVSAIPAAKEYTVSVVYTGTIAGKSYTETVASTTVSVAKAAITGVSVAQKGTLTYTGEAQTPAVSTAASTVNGQTATFAYGTTEGVYGEMPAFTNAGEYTVYYQVTAPNHASVEGSFTATIAPKSISGAVVTLSAAQLTYNRADQTVSVTGVTLDGTALTASDYEATSESALTAANVGTYTVTVSGKGNYSGTASATWSIVPKALEDGDFSGLAASYPYTGAAQTPALTSELVADTDYTAAYTGNINVGTATITLTGKGNYTGTVTKTFAITKAARPLSVSLDRDTLYRNGVAVLTLTYPNVDNSAKEAYILTGDTYAVVRKGNTFTANGTGTVTVTVSIPATDNYEASETRTVTLTVVSQPTLELTVTNEADAGAKLTAVAKGDTVTLSGSTTTLDLTKLHYTVDGYTASVSADGKKLVVKAGEEIVGEYAVNGSAVAVTSVTVALTENSTVTPGSDDAANDAMNGTAIENLGAAALKEVLKQAGADVKAVKIVVTTDIRNGKTEKSGDAITSLQMEITAKVELEITKMDDTVETKTMDAVLTAPVKVSVALPDGFTPNLVKHTHGTDVEYLPVTVETVSGTRYAVWYQSSFSTVELMADDTVVSYDFGGSVMTYTASSVGMTLPVPSGSGTFLGWSYLSGGTKVTTKVLTYDMLQAMKAEGFTATASFDRGSGGGGGGAAAATFAITAEKADNGTVTLSRKIAPEGATITVTVKANEGYVLQTLTVLDESGKAVAVKNLGGGKYSFEMPASKIKVSAVFVKAGTAQFTDVSADFWAFDAIMWAKENGYMNGNTLTTFNPGGAVTRQQLWMILARMAGAAPANMAEAKAWAVANGISDGSNPTAAVSRQQMVTILYRYTQLKGYDTKGGTGLGAFPDAGQVAGYAKEAMDWSVTNGIVGGTAQGTLNPSGTANRAQFATILKRFSSAVVK